MPVQVYRCSHCGREVLVRAPGSMTRAEIDRRIEEEMRPAASGRRAERDLSTRLRDYIWEGISAMRGAAVPRDRPPERCPACNRDTLAATRTLDE